jgi:hypothetical protein
VNELAVPDTVGESNTYTLTDTSLPMALNEDVQAGKLVYLALADWGGSDTIFAPLRQVTKLSIGYLSSAMADFVSEGGQEIRVVVTGSKVIVTRKE